jgi:putative ABC transport system permease protein
VVARLQKEYESNRNHSVRLRTLHDQITGEARPALLVLMVAVGFVLLIGCANLANLLLARASSRQREIAIRSALGAGRVRILRQLLTESLLLAALGGTLGVALAYWGLQGLLAIASEQLPRASDVRLDGSILAFAAGLSLLTGLLFGLAPALDAARADIGETLKEGGRTTAGRTRHRLRALLVVGEVALSLVLLAGAGLLTRSMFRLLEVKPGFRPDNLITMWVSFSSSKYSSGRSSADFLRELLPRLEALPGVQGVAVSNDLPLEGQDTTSNPVAEGRQAPPGEELLMGMHAVNPGYFRAMGIPLLRGRELDARDITGATPVMVINETAAKRLFGDADPIGKHIGGLFGGENDPQPEVVGVVGDVRHNGLSQPASLDAYAPVAQQPWSHFSITLRAPGDPAPLVAAVRKEVLAVDPDMPVYGVRTMNEVMGETVAQRRVTLVFTAVFAAMALLLAAIGIYGVMSYGVTQRWHEIGVRVALGAQRADILRLVLTEGMLLAAIGVLLGVVGSLGLTRFLAGLLFGVEPGDSLTFASVVMLLALVALAACYVPARRATRVDPIVALRYE